MRVHKARRHHAALRIDDLGAFGGKAGADGKDLPRRRSAPRRPRSRAGWRPSSPPPRRPGSDGASSMHLGGVAGIADVFLGRAGAPLKNQFSKTAATAASRMPEWISVCSEWGSHWLKSGAIIGIIPRPSEMATIKRLCLLPLKSTVARMRMPVAATMPNITSPAPPRTVVGRLSTSAPIFRDQAQDHHDGAPRHADKARAHAGHADKPHVLRE